VRLLAASLLMIELKVKDEDWVITDHGGRPKGSKLTHWAKMVHRNKYFFLCCCYVHEYKRCF